MTKWSVDPRFFLRFFELLSYCLASKTAENGRRTSRRLYIQENMGSDVCQHAWFGKRDGRRDRSRTGLWLCSWRMARPPLLLPLLLRRSSSYLSPRRRPSVQVSYPHRKLADLLVQFLRRKSMKLQKEWCQPTQRTTLGQLSQTVLYYAKVCSIFPNWISGLDMLTHCWVWHLE